MNYLEKRGALAPNTRFNLLGNALVLIAPRDSALSQIAFEPKAFEQALGANRIALGDPAAVPAGKYAKEAFTALHLWGVIEPRAAYADNVRSAMVFVARGEAPLGVVYATDAASEPKVKVLATLPETSHPPIVYPAALTKGASGDAPSRFLAFLRAPESAAVFRKYGFVVLK